MITGCPTELLNFALYLKVILPVQFHANLFKADFACHLTRLLN